MWLKKLVPFVFIFLIMPVCFAGITSVDNSFIAGDQYSADFPSRLNRNTVQLENGINNIDTNQITDDTLLEADFADEINPRVRTYEGAACEYVYTGLLPVTSGTLATSISAGTAYPRGYRVNKSSTTAHSFTASKWTFVDVDQSGNFQYSEQTIGGSTPSVATNSIRLARVSTDTATVNNVQDLRRTSCANGPFSAIADTSGEATLSDLLSNGAYVRRYSPAGRTPSGFAHGAFVSFDTSTTFKVTKGALYINGKYRISSQDITIPTTADDPTNGISGVDTSIASSTRYFVYGVADQDAVKGFSVTYSANASVPAGVTNARLIGTILTDTASHFTSTDTATAHGISERELPIAWIKWDGTGTPAIKDSYNVSGLADNGVGDYTFSWDIDPANAFYAIAGSSEFSAGQVCTVSVVTATAGTLRVQIADGAEAARDKANNSVIIFGDNRQ